MYEAFGDLNNEQFEVIKSLLYANKFEEDAIKEVNKELGILSVSYMLFHCSFQFYTIKQARVFYKERYLLVNMIQKYAGENKEALYIYGLIAGTSQDSAQTIEEIAA